MTWTSPRRPLCGCLSWGTRAGFVVECCGATPCMSTYVTPAWAPAASLSSLPTQRQSTHTPLLLESSHPLRAHWGIMAEQLESRFPGSSLNPGGHTHPLPPERLQVPVSCLLLRLQQHQILSWPLAQKPKGQIILICWCYYEF